MWLFTTLISGMVFYERGAVCYFAIRVAGFSAGSGTEESDGGRLLLKILLLTFINLICF